MITVKMTGGGILGMLEEGEVISSPEAKKTLRIPLNEGSGWVEVTVDEVHTASGKERWRIGSHSFGEQQVFFWDAPENVAVLGSEMFNALPWVYNIEYGDVVVCFDGNFMEGNEGDLKNFFADPAVVIRSHDPRDM